MDFPVIQIPYSVYSSLALYQFVCLHFRHSTLIRSPPNLSIFSFGSTLSHPRPPSLTPIISLALLLRNYSRKYSQNV